MRPSGWPLALALFTGCAGDKPEETGDTGPDPDGWTIIAQDQPGAFLSIWANSTSNVWTVGADGGSGPGCLHYDGTSWTSISLDTSGDLWWVTSTGGDNLWMVGADGRVLRYTISTAALEETVLDPDVTFFGVWAASDTDVWAVGGNITQPGDAAAVYHYDGTAWTPATLPEGAASAYAIYKIWGRSSTDVWAVGTGGVAMNWDGTAWNDSVTGTDRNLFTVSGTASDLFAVGGQFDGTILHGDGTVWTDETADFSPQFNGVSAAGPQPVAVGTSGAVYVRTGTTWAPDARGAVTTQDLHAVWADPDGGIWTVGGHLSSYPLDHGIVAYGGDAAIPSL